MKYKGRDYNYLHKANYSPSQNQIVIGEKDHGRNG